MKKALIFVNPKSGKGRSISILENIIPEIKKKYIIEIVITKYKHHIYIYFENNISSIKKNNLIISMGGDGLAYEIINSLKINNLNIPLAEIPTGSSNGYFKSLTNYLNKDFSIDSAINIINDYNIKNVDIMKINNLNLYSRLAISWGIVSNIDIGTEWMRKIGTIRYDIGAVWNILKKTIFKGTLKYHNIDNTWTTIENEFIFFWASNVSHASKDVLNSPSSYIDDKYIHISYITENISRFNLIKVFLTLSSGNYVNYPYVQYIKTKRFKLCTNSGLIVVDGEPIMQNDIDVEIVENNNLILS